MAESKSPGHSDLNVKFPPLPSTVADVARLLRSKEENLKKLSELVEHDPMMAAAILRRVNSAYFAVRREVTCPKKAVALLGFRDVCNLVMTTGFLRLEHVITDRTSRIVFSDLIQLSLGTALYADLIAKTAGLRLERAAFSSGLLHACGRLVLLQNRGESYAALCKPGTERPFPEAPTEYQHFGTDHVHLGAAALNHWNMPGQIARVVGGTYAPGRLSDLDERAVALTVSVAISATRQLCLRAEPDRGPFRSRAALHVVARSSGTSSESLRESIVQAEGNIRERLARLAGEVGVA